MSDASNRRTFVGVTADPKPLNGFGTMLDVFFLLLPLPVIYLRTHGQDALSWQCKELMTGVYGASVAMAASFGNRKVGLRVIAAVLTGVVMAVPFFSATFDAVMGFGLAVAAGFLAVGAPASGNRGGLTATLLKHFLYRMTRALVSGLVYFGIAMLPFNFGVVRANEGQFTRDRLAFVEVTYSIVFWLIMFDLFVRLVVRVQQRRREKLDTIRDRASMLP